MLVKKFIVVLVHANLLAIVVNGKTSNEIGIFASGRRVMKFIMPLNKLPISGSYSVNDGTIESLRIVQFQLLRSRTNSSLLAAVDITSSELRWLLISLIEPTPAQRGRL